MKKSVLFTALIAAVSAFNASAESFTVNVAVNKVLTPLSITQNNAMIIPTIQVDESLNNGDTLCSSYQTNYMNNNYCTGSGTNGKFTVSGTPYSSVSVVVDNTGQNISNGLLLNLYAQTNNGKTDNRTLDATGNAAHEVRGDVLLEDFNAVTSGNVVFNYNLTATYN